MAKKEIATQKTDDSIDKLPPCCPESSNKANKEKLTIHEIARDFAQDFVIICNNKREYIGLRAKNDSSYDVSTDNFLHRGNLEYLQLSWKEFLEWMRKKYGRYVILPEEYHLFLNYAAGYYGKTVWGKDRIMISILAESIAKCIRKDYIIEASRQSKKIKKMYNRNNNCHEALRTFLPDMKVDVEPVFSNWINRWLEDNCGLKLTKDWTFYYDSSCLFVNELAEKIMHALYSNADIVSDNEYVTME